MRRTRHSLLVELARRRRAEREPTLVELGVGLAAFIVIAAGGLYLATAVAG